MNEIQGYQEKILIFFDILGFKNLVLNDYKDEPDKISKILSTMHLMSSGTYSSEVIFFSDSVVNIIDSKPRFKTQNFSYYLDAIMSDISNIQYTMLNTYGVLIRGSIVLGDIIFNKEINQLFGPALIKAYELESEISIYPRFIVETNLIKKLGKDINRTKVTRDFDGHYYVDLFKWLITIEEDKAYLHKLKLNLEEKINTINSSKKPNLSVLSKYHWFLGKITAAEQMESKSIKD
ncbi:hypothetical protein CEQ21_07640 (plasmid) [Niallia circulans]|uniref:Guanylate cyclase domain-containing protein n=1 Tax=Niallia circulans TaxID=1397 RepID=A0A553SQG6_NIACI|nr:hypothetical protein [Niallia circulans]TRZ39232.1 hypothetical protein CEQ21_07640 [Niallia circulans]